MNCVIGGGSKWREVRAGVKEEKRVEVESGGGAKAKNGRVRVEESARWVGRRWKRRLYVEERGNSERGKTEGRDGEEGE